MYKEPASTDRNHSLPAIQASAFLSKGDFPMKVMVVSPHVDDAAFSLAGTLKVFVSAGCSIRIINCFTLSRYAPFAVAGDPRSVMTRRRQEEEIFLHHLGGDCESDELGLVDAPARGRGLRGILARHDSSQDITESIRLLLENLEEVDSDTAILMPLAIGNHSDHYIARQAALAKYQQHAIAFYEDQPYASGLKNQRVDAIEETSSHLGERLEPLLVHWPGDSQWKRQCCSYYKSQISEAGIRKIVDYMKRNSGERLWCSARFLEAWRWQATRQMPAMCQEPYFM